MKPRLLSRRSLVSSALASAVALPWLETWQPRSAQAQAGKPPLRFVVIVSCDGVMPELFWPRLPNEPLWVPDDAPKSEYLGGVGTTDQVSDKTVPAVDTKDFVFSPGMQPLERHKDDLLIVEGLDASGGPGHDHWPSMLTGRTGRVTGISLDQAIANEIAGDTKFKSLQLGVRTDNGIPFSAYGPDQPALMENDPQAVFDRVFADVGDGQDTAAALAAERLRMERKSVLDAVSAEITDLEQQASQADRVKLQNYFDSLREVEMRLSASAGASLACGRPEIASGEGDWWRNDENIDTLLTSQLDMLAMALACDLTRVGTVSVGNNNADIKFPFLDVNIGRHSLGHLPDSDVQAQKDQNKIVTWKSEHIARFADALKSIPEGDGTVFDNTLIYWCRELTKGNHNTANIPHVLIGSAQKFFETGRYIRLPRAAGSNSLVAGYPAGRWSNDFKAVVLQSMGAAVDTFGDPEQFGSPLVELRGNAV